MAEVVDPALATAGKPCNLGSDPSKYLEKFEDWYEHTSLLADSIGIKDTKQKLKLILLWGGRDFRKLAKDSGVVTVATEAVPEDGIDAAIKKIREKFGTHVNLAMAVFRLMHCRQGTRSVTEYLKELDELGTQCQFTEQAYTKERAMKDAYIFGTSDDKLRQEALAKDLDFEKLRRAALGYEQSRRASGQIKTTSPSESEVRQVNYSQNQVDEIVARVMAGKYSARNQSKPGDTSATKCPNCPPHYRPHPPGKCPAKGKTCAVCKRNDHFARSQTCQGAGQSIRSVETGAEAPEQYKYDRQSDKYQVTGRVDVIEVNQIQETHQQNMTSVEVNGHRVRMFVDSGCKKNPDTS